MPQGLAGRKQCIVKNGQENENAEAVALTLWILFLLSFYFLVLSWGNFLPSIHHEMYTPTRACGAADKALGYSSAGRGSNPARQH
jgi:hypothetical protein